MQGNMVFPCISGQVYSSFAIRLLRRTQPSDCERKVAACPGITGSCLYRMVTELQSHRQTGVGIRAQQDIVVLV